MLPLLYNSEVAALMLIWYTWRKALIHYTMKKKSMLCGALFVLVVFVVAPPVIAKVSVSVNGSSNGTALYGYKGPSGIHSAIRVAKSGGSILKARSRAVFHQFKVIIGNEVVSNGTDGDDDLTHVRAGSMFYGKAKFIGARKGQTVKNFKIKYHVDGSLSCFTPDDSVPEGYSLASVETQVRFNGVNRFAGTASVDGLTGYDGGTGDLAGEFDGDTYSVSIDKDFTMPLGKVRDGRTYPMLFFGATLVSYASDVPIDYCEADFFNSSDMSVTEETKKKSGSVVFTSARNVETYAIPETYSFSTFPDVTVYIEDEDEEFLNSIDVNTVLLFDRLGDSGSLQPFGGIGDVGDADSDGIPDRGVVFLGLDTYNPNLYSLLYNYIFFPQDPLTLYIVGDTEDGEPFMSKLLFHVE